MADAALEGYGMGKPAVKVTLQAGNGLYRVRELYPKPSRGDDDLFEKGQYLLRIYYPGWQTPEALELELAWLEAMRREAGLPVPEPVRRLDGRLLGEVSVPGIPQPRNVALMRWIKGRLLPNYGRPEHYRAQGRLMGRMHNFSQGWQLPERHSKRHYDWNGLFMNDPEIGLAPGECWKTLRPEWVEPFKIVAERFRELMNAWGTGSEVYGLIHADMGLDANVLFWHGEPRPIDFDGSGLGYWVYDLATALAHNVATPDYDRFRDALLEGYAEFRTLPEGQIAQLDLFTAAFDVYYILWMVGVEHISPGELDEKQKEAMERAARFILQSVR
jgi:Ser/Thr protein kinase RdoA (MazF antagonist)